MKKYVSVFKKLFNIVQNRTFSALKHRNYRFWFFGQMISLFGSWMQIMAQGYLIFELTGSPVYLGYVGFAQGIPAWLFMMFGGLVADRLKKRTILIYTQLSLMMLALILALLTFLQIVQTWHIILLALGVGIANSFDAPTRLAFVNELVHKEDLTNAIALNSTMFNIATAVGPAAAGIIYSLFGPAWCFTINGITYVAVITALLFIKVEHIISRQKGKSKIEQLKDGVKYVKSHKLIRTLIIMVGSFSLFGISFITLVPAWAVKILGGDAATNGYILSARGLGAIVGSLAIATLGRFTFKGKMLFAAAVSFPVFLFIFSFIREISFSLFLIFLVGLSLVIVLNLANSLVQTNVEESIRGRVMGIYTSVFFGLMPLGSLLMGFTAELFGEPATVVFGSVSILLVIVIFYFTVPSLKRE